MDFSEFMQAMDNSVIGKPQQGVSSERVNKQLIPEPKQTFEKTPAINKNKFLTDALGTIELLYKIQGKEWNVRGTRLAIIALKQLDFTVRSIEDVKDVKGIGSSAKRRIGEVLDNGCLSEVNEKEEVLLMFYKVWGAGPITVRQWYNRGFRTLEDLKKIKHELPLEQQLGLKYYKDITCKIPRNEVKKHANVVKKAAQTMYPEARIDICGSYRREREECGDIDVMITVPCPTPDGVLERIINVLIEQEFIVETLHMSEYKQGRTWQHHFDKFMGISILPGGKCRRLDIVLLPSHMHAGVLFYFTGSNWFNRDLRMYVTTLDAKTLLYYVTWDDIAILKQKN
eukprot:CAMPEP_0168526534 /NCGR_PEP_ID=MMETSP0405-20121227/12040_1 /TAXON_ID=498012 /ORGANISM="Trichosphaerium sp, Strain Am-I-7 wt" /LENGTH=340 /DNA_ID=CAMNT_0008549425 /DNA_START=538 /DNA_END=1560 /DNA_ORIENTATION=+